MKRYFIKVIATATDNNPNFAGTVIEYIYGKKEEIVGRKTISDPNGHNKYIKDFDDTKYKNDVLEYGFTSKGRAEAVAKKVHDKPDMYGHWTDEISVIETEIDD